MDARWDLQKLNAEFPQACKTGSASQWPDFEKRSIIGPAQLRTHRLTIEMCFLIINERELS